MPWARGGDEDDTAECDGLVLIGGGMLSIGMEDCTTPGAPVATRSPNGLGLLLRKLPMGLANPLPGLRARIESKAAGGAGATTEMWSKTEDSGDSSMPARMDAALSRTEGTACSSCSVPFARGILCGFWPRKGGEGGAIGSMSRSKMADDEE